MSRITDAFPVATPAPSLVMPALGAPQFGSRGRRRCQGDDGGAVAELSLLLPFLAMITFGTIDVGRAMQLKGRLTNMAREGAVYAKNHPYDVSGCPATTNNAASVTTVVYSEDTGVSNPTVTVLNVTANTAITGCNTTPSPGTQMRVKVTKAMPVFTPFVGMVVGSSVNVTSSVDVVATG